MHTSASVLAIEVSPLVHTITSVRHRLKSNLVQKHPHSLNPYLTLKTTRLTNITGSRLLFCSGSVQRVTLSSHSINLLTSRKAQEQRRRTMKTLEWRDLESYDTLRDDVQYNDLDNGLIRPQANVRLFGTDPENVRVTLYKDKHSWCPYCSKIWLWLEEKRIPYRISTVTMFCYGEKEAWYKQKVPSGMLPALQLDDRTITESDTILLELEQAFGPLEYAMNSAEVRPLRALERQLFRSWCGWLCRPSRSAAEEKASESNFRQSVADVEMALASTKGPYFLPTFSVADTVFLPYVERMSASLFYYKGYTLRDPDANPHLSAWFDAMETRGTYRGIQSDFHTHVHDLPPQMGGCYANNTTQAHTNQKAVDEGPWLDLPDVKYQEPQTSRIEALHRVLKHRSNIIKANPLPDDTIDEALRCALTNMVVNCDNGKDLLCVPPEGSDSGLRYIRDRVNVPRDMSIYAGKRFREALEATASLIGTAQGPPIPLRHRYDQNPKDFDRTD